MVAGFAGIAALWVAEPRVNAAATSTTLRVSVSSTGVQANGKSAVDAISPNGRFVLFDSRASNLVRGDTNGVRDVFLRDRKFGRTVRVSVGPTRRQANGPSFGTMVTGDGRFILFTSVATNLTSQPDRNHNTDVFVRDRSRGATFRVSVPPRGGQFPERYPYGFGIAGGISDDGRWVAFGGYAPTGATRTFVRDRARHKTHWVHGGRTFSAVHGYWLPSALSADGRWLALAEGPDFGIAVRDLATGDTTQLAPGGSGFGGLTPTAHYVAYRTFNGETGVVDTWRWNRITGKRLLVHRGWVTPEAGSVGCEPVSISAGGRYISCWSDDSTLVPGDTNGWDDLFRIDIRTGSIIRLDLNSTGGQLPGGLSHPDDARMSGNGRWAVFDTADPHVVSGDTNRAADVFVRGPLDGSGGG